MKTVLSRILCLALLAFAFVFPAHAQYTTQLEETTLPVGEFTTVSANGDFDLTLSKGTYSVRVITDKNLSPYVQVYVRSKTLFITYDEKAVPKDIKKLYKGKNTPKPVFRAVISLPELNGFTLEDNVVLNTTEEFFGSNVTMVLSDKALVKNLKLSADNITLTMSKNAQATAMFTADNKLELNTDDKTVLKLTEKAREVILNAKGNSENAFSGDCNILNLNLSEKTIANMTQQVEKAVLNVGGSSKLAINGKAAQLVIKGDKSAEVDAAAFPVQQVNADMSGNSKANVAVEKELTVNLQGGSSLFFTGSPTILVGKIVKSTLAPAGTVK